jgi:hypothetical protein
MTKPSAKCRARVKNYIRDHFPDMTSVKPSVSSRKHGGQLRHRFTFRKNLKSSNGGRFRQIVHVATDEEGNVTKVNVSR